VSVPGHTPPDRMVGAVMATGQKIPDASHPITITATPGTVRVTVGDTVVAESSAALTLQESTYPPVQYVPLADVDAAVITKTDSSSYCPFKGDASYYSVQAPDGTLTDAAWTYEDPYDAVAQIADHVAFYPNKVTVEVSD
jgi:uncharacterized protein (DUF427 family)